MAVLPSNGKAKLFPLCLCWCEGHLRCTEVSVSASRPSDERVEGLTFGNLWLLPGAQE